MQKVELQGVKSRRQGIRKLLNDGLANIYKAEKSQVNASSLLLKHSSSLELNDAMNHHLSMTDNQVKRLEKLFEAKKIKIPAGKCVAMEGILREGKSLIESAERGPARDAVIILAVQKASHYQIASYGSIRSFAMKLGEEMVAAEMEETLNEEKESDVLFSRIAELSINREANEGSEQNERNNI